MRKNIKIISAGLISIILCIIAYYAIEIIIARNNTPGIIQKALTADRIKLQIEDLSKWQLDALLAVEDPNFYNHHGIDFKTPGAGITTITQGLVKIFYFDHFKPGIAKLKQSLIARYALDPLVSKNNQLTLFINYIYLGNVQGKTVYGFADAAEGYYKKPFNKLSQDEYPSIVAMIIAPLNFTVITHHQANAERTGRIKKVISGEYKPKGLMDVYYGRLSAETVQGLPPASYYPSIYDK
jgi:membrane peptidoglycan carboxypeptidase